MRRCRHVDGALADLTGSFVTDRLMADGAASPSIARSSLLGRQEELAAATRLLASEGVRLLTLTGPAGVGKTRLAQELVSRRAVEDGAAVVVALSSIRAAELVSDAIISALPGVRRPELRAGEALWAVFGGAPVLLLLDNLEQIPGAAAVVLEVLDDYPAARVVATSQRPLAMSGEHVLRLQPFPRRTSSANTDADSLGADPAVAMFLERAVAADVGFSPSYDDLLWIAAVCDEVGGLPLAIGIAAARVRSIPPAVMAQQLSTGHALDVLRHPVAGGEDRHAGLQDALQWSYDLLSEQAQTTVRRSAVFEGSFTLDSAQPVIDPDLDAAHHLDALAEAVDSQLLMLDLSDENDPRFGCDRLVRSFALHRLAQSGEADGVLDRHSQHFRRLCTADASRVDREWPDVVVALDRAVAQGKVGDALLATIAAAPAVADRPGAAAMLHARMEELIESGGQGRPDEAARLARALLWSARQPPDRQGDMQAVGLWTSRRLARSLSLARSSGDTAAVLAALELQVRALPTTLDLASSMAAVAEGLDLAQRWSDEAILARFEVYDAMVMRQRGDLPAAIDKAVTALHRARRAGDNRAETGASILLLQVPADLCPLVDPPLPSRNELLAHCEATAQRREAMTLLAGLAATAVAQGDLHTAAGYIHRQLLLAAGSEVTDPLGGVVPVLFLVVVAAAGGEAEAAVRLHSSVAALDEFLPFVLPPEVLAPYLSTVAGLRTAVPPDLFASYSAETAAMTLPQANRHAQTVARALAAPERRASPPPAPEVPTPSPASMTPRQREVLLALASGRTNKEIAELLRITPKSVMHHSMAVYRALGVRGRAEATAFAYRHRLVKPDQD